MYNFEKKHRKDLWKRAKQRLRRNVRLRIKAGLYEDLREVPKVERSTFDYDDYDDNAEVS